MKIAEGNQKNVNYAFQRRFYELCLSRAAAAAIVKIKKDLCSYNMDRKRSVRENRKVASHPDYCLGVYKARVRVFIKRYNRRCEIPRGL